ncbi:MAG: carboxypeptidase-like regulatory domain-containing protein [Candidatus Brocadiaceae bacterium]
MINLIFKRYLNKILFLCGMTIFFINTLHGSYAGTGKTNINDDLFMHSRDVNVNADNGKNNEDEDEDESHNPGKNCLNSKCHGGGEEHFFAGGTIYQDPEGTQVRTGAEIKITDANGTTETITSDQLGNIYTNTSLNPPFTISVSYKGREVKMPGEAPHGGCNAKDCHVAGAADRVFISAHDLDLTGVVTETVAGNQEISYTSDIKSILDAKCISCHKKGGQKSDTPLTTYAEVTAPRLITPGDPKSLILQKLNKNGTMWVYLKSISNYRKIKKWIVKYNAQEFSATSGVAVSDAEIKLLQNGKVKYTSMTDGDGRFTLDKVKAGEYTLRVSRDGYATYSQPYQMYQRNVTPLAVSLEKN